MGEHTFEDIDEAATSLETMVNGVDVATLTGPGAARLAQRLVTAERVLAACRARALRRATEANQWRQAGERSPAAWAAKVTGTSAGHAAAELETTRQLEALPATAAAAATGAISPLQARELASAATVDPTAEAELLRRAKVDDAAAFKKRCARVRAAAETDEAAARERIRRDRHFRSWTDAAGAFCFAGRGLAEDGAALLAAMKPYQDAAFHAARRRGEHERTDSYAYDGLIGMANHQCPPSATPRAGAATSTKRDGRRSSAGAGMAEAEQRQARETTPDTNPTSASTTRRSEAGEAASGTSGHPDVTLTRRHEAVGTATATPAMPPASTGRRTATRSGPTAPDAGAVTLFDTPPAACTGPSSPGVAPDDEGVVHDRDAVLAGCFRPGPGVKLIVRIDHTALTRGHTVPGETCEIEGVGPISVATARELARDAFLTAVVTDGIDIRAVVHLGRAATAHQRTTLEARGTRCAVPGCGLVHGLQIDHVDGWAITRRTHIDQLDWLCTFHHSQKTHHSYRLEGPPGNRTWHPPGTPDPRPDTS